ncbi:MAG: PorV/PorQ family protein [Candidatus Firestonebacteria bacterium]
MVLFLPCCVFATSPNAGTSGASFLKIGPGARPAGLGESFTAVANDSNAAYWNPAGLAKVSRTEFSAMHLLWLTDMKYDYITMVFPFKGSGTLGISGTLLTMGDFQGYDSNGNLTSSFNAYDFNANLSWGSRVALDPEIFMGFTLKYIQQVIENTTGRAVAADIGFLWVLFKNGFLGLNVQNLGQNMKFGNGTSPLPMTTRVGFAVLPTEGLTIATDVSIPRDDDVKVSIGIENWIENIFAVRAGYWYKTGGMQYSSSLTGLTAGAGFAILDSYGLDYAFEPYEDLGNTHRISLTLKF